METTDNKEVTSDVTPESTTDSEFKPVVEKTKWIRNWKKWSSITVAVLIVICTGYITYAKYDMFKSPFQIYVEAEAQNVTDISTSFSKSFEEINKLIIDGNQQQKASLNLSLDGLERVPENIRPVYQFITELTFNQEIRSNKDKSELAGAFSINHNKDLWANVDFAYGKSIGDGKSKFLGVKLMPFYDRWLYANLDNMKDSGLQNIPRKVYTYDEWKAAIQPSISEFLPIALRYSAWFNDHLNKDQFKIESGSSFEVDGKSIQARKLTIEFTESELKAFIVGLMKQVASDDELLTLIHTRYEKALQMYADTTGTPLTTIQTLAQWKTTLQANAEDADKSLKQTKIRKAEMVVFVDMNDHLLSRTLQFELQSIGEKEWSKIDYSSAIDNTEDPRASEFKLLLTQGNITYADTSLKTHYMIMDEHHQMTHLTMNQKLNIPDQGPFIWSANINTNEENQTDSNKSDADITFAYGEKAVDTTLRGTFGSIVKTTNNQIDSDWNLIWDVSGSQMAGLEQYPAKIGMHVKSSSKAVDELNLPKFDPMKDKEMTKPTAEDEQEVSTALQDGFSKWLQEHLVELSTLFPLFSGM